MEVVAIVQARMESTRLPGKVLADLAGRTMLARVVRRVRRAALVDRVAVATSDAPEDDVVAAECRRLAVPCFHGSENDVLDRYRRAAGAFSADVVVRVTADCPMIDPGVIDLAIAAFLRARPDYASNTLRRTWPRGLDTEVTTAAALDRAWREATEDYQRVHVMPYFYQNPDRFGLLSVTGPHDLGDWRWTVDTPEDLEFARAIFGRLGPGDGFSWRDVRRLVTAEPSLADINRHVRQKALVVG